MTEPQQKTTHESYGALTITHQHGPPISLFGSPVEHSDVVRLEIHTASLLRSLHQDHILSDTPIFVGYLSHSQLANALFALAPAGPPTPITIRYILGDKTFRNDPPPRDPRDLIDAEIQQSLHRILEQCDELIETSKGSAKRRARGLKAALENQIPFILERLRETHQQTADDAKQEVTAFIHRSLSQLGLQALADDNRLLHLPGPPSPEGQPGADDSPQTP